MQLPIVDRCLCHAALDYGWRNHIASLYLSFPLSDRRFLLQGWSWIPEQAAVDLSAQPWKRWIADGRVCVTRGDTTDLASIYAKLEELRLRYHIASVAMDLLNCRAVGIELDKRNFNVRDFGQTAIHWDQPLAEFFAGIEEGRILHNNDCIFMRAVSNVVIRRHRGLAMPDKQSSSENINPFVAAAMAFAGCLSPVEVDLADVDQAAFCDLPRRVVDELAAAVEGLK